ncbi:hypothetical protein H9649_00180 [Sporosarcina sp. Sa2YVA2]|uniref:Uncharacterized protein n=1 Tax=Sporosarcina quadrami TaxID=2762234 RepID=A0ABR8U624_9BACL|nr:hypothetical protein [Sporosarcina quadrami]MBD7982979.1 hypothetical protein [Sporosarcina quadrami]
MKIDKHNIITLLDENNQDVVGEFLSQLSKESQYTEEAKLHLMFLHSAFNLLSVQPLENLINTMTEITIILNGHSRTKRYELVKPLKVIPIYELRYAMNQNEHLRFLFFPFQYKGESNYIFVKYFKKTWNPTVDETNEMRDLTYQMYKRVQLNPEFYLEGTD